MMSPRNSSSSLSRNSPQSWTSELDSDSWADELEGKISLFDEPLRVFFNQFVPSFRESVGMRPWRDPTEVFSTVLDTTEVGTYEHIISGLNSMVAGFDPQFRPQFASGSQCAVCFPFKAWEDEHDYTMPDVVMSFPGVSEEDTTWMKTWDGISLVLEVKMTQDPIDEDAPWPHVKHGNRARGILSQLAKSARNMMLTHRMLYVYVVGIYRTQARIYRFDHAACAVSRSFDIKTHPWPLHELLWRFCRVHSNARILPEGQPSGAVLGVDPTILPASDEDLLTIEEYCKATGKPLQSDEEKKACRWITIPKYDDDGTGIGATRYLAFRDRFLSPRLFSRATAVVDALEEGSYRPVVVKDAWRQVARDREDTYYDKIDKAMRNKSLHELLEDYVFMHRKDTNFALPPRVPFGPYKTSADGPEELPIELEDFVAQVRLEPGVGTLFGLPTVKHADDLGERQVDKAACRHSSDDSTPASLGGAGSSSAASDGAPVPVYEGCHRTMCGALRSPTPDSTAELNERSHMRLVMETVGRPLHEFSSTKELVHAFRDAIIGHRQAYRAGIIHRDISNNNVLISDSSGLEPKLLAFIGFLIDFDYGFDWKTALRVAGWPEDEESWKQFVADFNANLPFKARDAATDRQNPVMGTCNPEGADQSRIQDQARWEAGMKIKERTGTLQFMAIEILRTTVAHEVHHDLESFFWLLIWIVLRHTAHNRRSDPEVFLRLFGSHTGQSSAAAKLQFLAMRNQDWEVPGNEPLNTLINKFRALVCDQNLLQSIRDPLPPVHLTYESVLAIFDEALADQAWPAGDKALPFSKDGSSSQLEQGHRAAGIKRVRDDADLDDPFAMPCEPAPKRVQVCSPLRNEGVRVEDGAGDDA